MATRSGFDKEELWRATRLFKDGRMGEGWDAYEGRFREQPDLGCPRWRGEDLSGKHLWVRREQGVGDEVHFASCFPDVVRRARATTITCDRRLHPIFARSFPGAQVIAEDPYVKPTRLPSGVADCWIQSGSLGRFLRRSLDDFPREGSFLVADPERRARFRAWLDEECVAAARVGIAWMGGVHLGLLRQAPWDVWIEILRSPDVQFVNLQYGPIAPTIDAVSRYAGVRVLRPEIDMLDDLDGYAALVSALDFVISVPNTTTHFAGSLGVPNALLFDPGWGCLWITRDRFVPWYPGTVVAARNEEVHWSTALDTIRGAIEGAKVAERAS